MFLPEPGEEQRAMEPIQFSADVRSGFVEMYGFFVLGQVLCDGFVDGFDPFCPTPSASKIVPSANGCANPSAKVLLTRSNDRISE